MILIYTLRLSLFFCTEREVKAIMFDVVMITLRESLEAILLVSLAAVYRYFKKRIDEHEIRTVQRLRR
jgi:high-affinity Fe2+/Pb2+ permease